VDAVSNLNIKFGNKFSIYLLLALKQSLDRLKSNNKTPKIRQPTIKDLHICYAITTFRNISEDDLYLTTTNSTKLKCLRPIKTLRS